MAILLKDNSYLKFESDGTFYIYKNKKAREKIKNATPSEIVLNKYIEILNSLSNPELLYYSPEDRLNLKKWKEEARLYKTNLDTFNINGQYPLMQQYINDVADTIPEIIFCAKYLKLAQEANYSLKNIYKAAKNRELFGKKDEIKNC